MAAPTTRMPEGSPFWRNDGFLSPVPPDDQLQGNGSIYLDLRFFRGGATARAGEVEDAVFAEGVVVDAVVFQESYVPQEPPRRRIGTQALTYSNSPAMGARPLQPTKSSFARLP